MDLKSIISSSQDITLEATTDAQKFCQVWPQVEEGLILLQSLIKNPVAKASIGIVMAAGNAVSKEVCKNSN